MQGSPSDPGVFPSQLWGDAVRADRDSADLYAASHAELHVSHPGLRDLIHQTPERCAAVSEYAEAIDSGFDDVLDLLAPHLGSGALAVEPAGGQMFLHTAPSGRPPPARLPGVPPNLWERLRRNAPPEAAFRRWQRVRALERAGWQVRVGRHPSELGCHTARFQPTMALSASEVLLPVVGDDPLADTGLADPNGPLGELERAAAVGAVVLVDSGRLDGTVTAVRRWRATHPHATRLLVVAMEEPGYAPVMLTSGDAAVAPKSALRAYLRAARNLPT